MGTLYIRLDVHKVAIAVSIAEEGLSLIHI